MKKLALATSLCEVSLKIKEKEVLFYRQTVVKLFHQSILNTLLFILFLRPQNTHILRHQETSTREEYD